LAFPVFARREELLLLEEGYLVIYLMLLGYSYKTIMDYGAAGLNIYVGKPYV